MINKNNLMKNVLTHLAAIILFLGISVIYFSPELEGMMLPQGDVHQYQGMSKELRDYYYNDGESSTWTNSMFSGMPSYQIAVWGGSPNFLDYAEAPLRALGNSIGPMFVGMIMAYILFLFMGMNPVLAALGGIAYSLSSYNIIILSAGHITKAWAIAYMPLIVAGMMTLFKHKYQLGGLLVALGLALQIKSNHLQITYYTGILCAFIFIAFAIEMVKEHKLKQLGKATAILTMSVALAILCNMGNIYANYEMGQTSTRGKSELTNNDKPNVKSSTGLEKDYAFGWSYGKAETISLMIPNVHGGSSGGMLDKSSHLYKTLVQQGMTSQNTGDKGIRSETYWGDQPSTSGPVYLGAVICFLFILGMLIIRSRLKWALLAATAFCVLLSWGRNFDAFNDIMFHYLPMYNKFRTVSMALVIPALTMIMIAMWGLKEFFANEIDKQKLIKSLCIAAGSTGGIALLLWIAPGVFFDFKSINDIEIIKQVPEWYYKALVLDREALLSADALRSLIFIVLSAAALYIPLNNKVNRSQMMSYSLLALIVLVVTDLWGVDKRYLNKSNFISKSEYAKSSFMKSPADEIILHNTDPSHRVLNLGNLLDKNQTKPNLFTESSTSYYHKSIGGYHPAKLGRYQELIDNNLSKEVNFLFLLGREVLNEEIMRLQTLQVQDQTIVTESINKAMQDSLVHYTLATSTLNMLNAKYIIYHPSLPPIVNTHAMGNAWFVDAYKLVPNADEEIAALGQVDLRTTIVVDESFNHEFIGLSLAVDSSAQIVMTECKPNLVKYKSKTSIEQLAVFSEIYYKYGWQAFVDGKPVNHVRCNWILRAMRVPAGEHDIEFRFESVGYNNSRTMASLGSAALLILLLLSIGYVVMRKETKKQ